MELQLKGRTALVTGASSGIGEAMVELLSAAGVRTVAVARRADRLAELAARCEGVEVLVADLTTAVGVAAVVARVADAERPVDLVVNNAGFGTSGDFHTLDPDRLEHPFPTDRLRATAAVTRVGSCLPRLRDAAPGS